MTTLSHPRDYVVPLIGAPRGPFLGTATFCTKDNYLITARHCIDGFTGELAIGILNTQPISFAAVRVIYSEPSIDIAVLKCDSYTPPCSLPMAEDSEILHNRPAYTYEYGTTITRGKATTFNPATRLGNVTRYVNNEDLYGLGGQHMLEMSFPALKGASGSPVIGASKLWGIIVANVSYHLLPTQIERVIDANDSTIEEVRFLLPQALAIHVLHVRRIIDRLNSTNHA